MYIQGFVIPVPSGNREGYLDMATKAAPVFADHGALRTVECWGDDVPTGKTTDFYRAVDAGEGETVAFSWVAWPDRATCDGAAGKMMADERMQFPPESMPFDGKRMIYGGFAPMLNEGDGAIGYVDGCLVAVPDANRQAYLDHASTTAGIFAEVGATAVVENWGEDVPDGKVTDFRRAVQAKDDEAVVFSWIGWQDKATRDAGWEKAMADPRLKDMPMPFDGKRMIYGGFVPILDTAA